MAPDRAAVQRGRGLSQPVGQQGPVGQPGQLVVQGLVGQGRLLLVETPLQQPAGLVELADDADQAAVAAEPHHIAGQGQHLLADLAGGGPPR